MRRDHSAMGGRRWSIARQPARSDTVSAAEHERLRRDHAALRDQYRGRPRGALGRGPVGGRSRHRPDDHRRERPTAVPVAGRPAVPAGGRCLPVDQGGRPVGLVDPVHRRASDAARPPDTHRPGRPGPHHPADRRRAGRPRLRRPRPPEGGRLPDHPGRPDAPRRRGRRRAPGVAQRGQPVRRAREDDRLRVRRPGGDGDERGEAGPAAGVPERRARPQGRRAGGAARGRGGRELQPRRRQRARRPSPSTPSSCPAPTVARSWSTPSRTAPSPSAASTAPSRAWSRSCTRSASTWTRPWSGLAARQRRPTRRDGPRRDRPRPSPGRPPRGRLAVGGGGPDAARRPDRRRPRRTPQADGRLLRGDPRPPGDVRQPVRDRPAQRPALPRAEGAELRARAGQPPQVRVPGQHVPRAADAAQRGPGLLRGASRADVRRHQRAPGGVPPRHPRVGQAPAGAAQRDPRPVQGRGRSDGARVLLVRPALGAGGDLLHAARTSRRARHRPARRDRRTTSPRSTPTSCGSSRSCSTW